MTEENIGQEFKLKEIEKIRNHFIQEIKQNELISKKHKKVCKILNYTQHLLILACIVTGCISISSLASCFLYSSKHCKFCINNKNFRNNCRN